MNSIIFVGRLTRDPEYTDRKGDKSQYAKFTVAVDNRFGDLASFFDCIAFGALADLIDKYLSKGRQVAIRGRMEQGAPYTDKNGNNRRSWSVMVEETKFLGSRNDSAPAQKPADPADSWEQFDDDNPF